MKTLTIAIAFLSTMLPATASLGQQTPTLAPPRPGFSFPLKQTLTYSVDWRVFPAGTAVVRFEADGDRENLTASADTIGAINLLFHVADRFQSSFDRAKEAALTTSTSRQSRAAAKSPQPSTWITPRIVPF